MGDVIKLGQFRKAKAKAGKEAQAGENRRKFGRTKAERKQEELNRKNRENILDQHKLPPDSDIPS